MANEVKAVENVTLRPTDVAEGKAQNRSFPIDQANALLKVKNSKWELADDAYFHNGSEIAKKTDKNKATQAEAK